MVKKTIRAVIIIVITGIIFLMLTNPGLERFKEYNDSKVQKRTANYFVFSIYEGSDYNTTDYQWHSTRYVGIALNFYRKED